MGRILRLILILIIIAAVAAAGAYSYYRDAIYSKSPAEKISEINVNEGQSFLDIAPTLQAQGVIKSSEVLRLYVRLEKPEVQLHEGKYEIPGGLDVPGLIEHLNKGPKRVSVNVTLQEGIRYDEMADKIADVFANVSDAKFSKDEFNTIAASPDTTTFSTGVEAFLAAHKPTGKSLEGFLFPDTYTIGTDATAKNVIDLMITNFIKRLDENDVNPKSHPRLKTFYEVLTIASIVEREANTLEDKKLVADIFMRRLEQRIVLGADATLLYKFKDWGYVLTNREINDTTNLYNTRKLPGLPPTPITNPSINAIKSVVSPTPSDYLYFVSTGGQNYYAKTLAGHQENIRKYL